MKNLEIREEAAKRNVKLWQIVDKIGITDSHFSRRLRKEFSTDEKAKILSIINELSPEQEAG